MRVNMMNFGFKNDELCTKNDEFCTKNAAELGDMLAAAEEFDSELGEQIEKALERIDELEDAR